METFLTTVCTNDLGTPEITTCEYGGVLPYIGVLIFLLTVFGIFYYYTIHILRETL